MHPIDPPADAAPTDPVVRYATAVPLAAGASAEVFETFDPLLKRKLALKVLRTDSPQAVARIVREARAQGRVQHAGICAVYDTGAMDGRPYIAMELIEGCDLRDARAHLDRTTIVRLVRDVARAMQVAHEAGLVHRDLKPENVMLRVPGGADALAEVAAADPDALCPVVVDFGLVWAQAEGSDLTRYGQVLGTPGFLSPEQARGDLDALDARTDVYALGATLYDLLLGRPPHDGGQADSLMAVARGIAPTAPRRIDPHLPRALEAILLTCLAPRPDDRYRRAADLADELDRVLRGETIHARAPSRLTRATTGVLQRRRGLLMTAAILLVAGALVLLMLRAQQAERQRLVRQFDEQADHLRWSLRAAHMGAPDDLAGVRAGVRARRDALMQARDDHRDPAVRAAIDHALGASYVALHDDARAAVHLQAAWNGGRRTPAVAQALGEVRGRQYGAAIRHARNQERRRVRQASRAAAVARYRDPAIALLRAAAGATTAPAYVEGLIALYEARHDDALAAADRAQAQLPWLYEADLVRGEAYVGRAAALAETSDLREAYEALVDAETAYRRVIAAAAAEPRAYLGLCGVLQLQQDYGHHAGDGARTTIHRRADAGLAACATAQALAPDDPRGWLLPTEIIATTGNLLRLIHGDDPRPMLYDAWAEARRVARRFPRDPQTHEQLGAIVHLIALAESNWNLDADPRPYEDIAIAHFQRALRLGTLRRAAVLSDIGHLYYQRGVYVYFYTSADVVPDAELGAAALRRAIALDPGWASSYSTLGTVHELLLGARFRQGQPYLAHVDAALANHRRFLAIRSTSAWGESLTGDAYWIRARHAFLVGEDITPWMTRALMHAGRARALDAHTGWYLLRYAVLWLHWAEYRVARGEDPTPMLQQAQRAYRLLITSQQRRANPVTLARLADGRVRLATVALRWALRTGDDPRAARDAAREAWAFSLANADDASTEVQEHQIDHLLARADLALVRPAPRGGDDPAALLDDVAQRLDQLDAAGSDVATASLRRGRMHLLRAMVQPAGSAARAAALASAEAAWTTTVTTNAWLAGEVAPWRRRAAALAGDDAPRVVGPTGDVR
ncbi:MAG: serine/threonine-protein kinase [Acidobacteriota bacterium]